MNNSGKLKCHLFDHRSHVDCPGSKLTLCSQRKTTAQSMAQAPRKRDGGEGKRDGGGGSRNWLNKEELILRCFWFHSCHSFRSAGHAVLWFVQRDSENICLVNTACLYAETQVPTAMLCCLPCTSEQSNLSCHTVAKKHIVQCIKQSYLLQFHHWVNIQNCLFGSYKPYHNAVLWWTWHK